MLAFHRHNDVNLEELNDGTSKDEEKAALLEAGLSASGVVPAVTASVQASLLK